MTKVVLKTVGSTLLAVILLLGMLFAVLSLVFPATMVETCATFGLDGLASRYSALEYDRSGRVEDIAIATEYAIFSGEDDLIVEYGSKLLADQNFDSVVKGEEKGYEQYIKGQVATALYRKDDKAKAIEIAFKGNDNSFPVPNSILSLSLSAIESKDKATCQSILEKLELFTVSKDQEKDLDNIKTLLKEITNE